MRAILPPPPKRKSAWQRYTEGERLIPTFERIVPKSNVIPPPPKPQEPKRINYGLYDVEKFGFIITLIICICTLILTIVGVIYDIIIK